jgi:zinc protease
VKDTRLRESAAQAGVATLVGDMLEEGTPLHTGDAIAAMIENVGGGLSFAGSGGTVRVLTPNTDLGLGLLFECLTQPSFPDDRLQSKREQLLAAIAAEETEPLKRARSAFFRAVYGQHPYGRSAEGKLETVSQLKRADLIAFHAANFVPNNTVVVVVGDFDTAAMTEKLRNLTAKWESKPLPKLALPAPPIPEKQTESIISDKTAAQTHVLIGHLGITRLDPDYYTLEVMDNVLGTGPGFTDRLSSTLRDRQGLAYTVRATITDDAGDEPGTFLGYIGTFPDKYTWVRDGFFKEIRRIREEVPSDREVDDAKQYLLGSMAFRLATSGRVAAELMTAERFGLGYDWYDKYRAAVSAVTPAMVKTAAHKHLHPNQLTVVAVGPIDEKGQPLAAPAKGGER